MNWTYNSLRSKKTSKKKVDFYLLFSPSSVNSVMVGGDEGWVGGTVVLIHTSGDSSRGPRIRTRFTLTPISLYSILNNIFARFCVECKPWFRFAGISWLCEDKEKVNYKTTR